MNYREVGLPISLQRIRKVGGAAVLSTFLAACGGIPLTPTPDTSHASRTPLVERYSKDRAAYTYEISINYPSIDVKEYTNSLPNVIVEDGKTILKAGNVFCPQDQFGFGSGASIASIEQTGCKNEYNETLIVTGPDISVYDNPTKRK